MLNPLFERYCEHIGHKIECVCYGDSKNIDNVSIECVDCNVVLTNENQNSEPSETE